LVFIGTSNRRLFRETRHASGAAKAIEFYKRALGAEEVSRMPEQGGGPRLMHATLRIGDATLFLCDDFPEYCGGVSAAPRADVPPCITLHLDVANCDAAIDRAVTAGATLKMPASDMFWGDRYGQVTDPFGHAWSFAHPLTDEQSIAAQKQWAQQCA
jgi:PhnB protein